jgi:hypothetical protein
VKGVEGDGGGVWRGMGEVCGGGWGCLGCRDDSGVSLFGWLGSRLANLSRKQAGIVKYEAGRIAG